MFVCMGNICRSPTAHALMEQIVDEHDLSDRIVIESSGTHAYHVGEQPDKRAQATASSRGLAMSHLRAQKIAINDYDRFDWIVAMDDDNLTLIEYYAPDNHDANCCLLMNFSSNHYQGQNFVPDPYYGGDKGFDDVFDMVEDACRGFLKHVIDSESV